MEHIHRHGMEAHGHRQVSRGRMMNQSVDINVKQIIHGMEVAVCCELVAVELSQHEVDINSEREYIRMDIHQHHGHIQVVHYDHVCISVIQVIYGIQQIKNVKL